jgi:CheY-like chemotaxis protein
MDAWQRAVLLIEDRGDDQMLFRQGMLAGGFSNPLHVVDSAEQALDYLLGGAQYTDRARFPFPQLIMLNGSLPCRSGVELLKWLRAHEETRAVPIAVLGSEGNRAERDEMFMIGASAYHVKPRTAAGWNELLKGCLGLWLFGRVNGNFEQSAESGRPVTPDQTGHFAAVFT